MLFRSGIIILGGILGLSRGATINKAARDGSRPSLPYDPNTTPYCTWWIDLAQGQSCDQVARDNFIDLATLRRWNPSLVAPCTLVIGRSYCVEAFGEPPLSSTTTTRPTTTTTTSKLPNMTTAPGNGIQTPTPAQPGMVSNCDQFYWVKNGEHCSLIATVHGIKLSMFLEWNPQAGENCGGLWQNAWACVSIIGVSSQPPSDFPEKVLDKVRAAERTISLMGPDVNNLVSRASGAWPGRHKEAADTFVWFHPISNTRLTSSTSVYVSSLLAGPRPSVKRRELAGNGTQPWEEWPIPEAHEAVEEKRATLHARDLYDDVLSKCKASLRTWSIMAPDVLNTANEAAAWWTGQPKELSKSFAEAWKMDTGEQIGLLQWFISTMESYGRP